jgi:hypothetical protein
MYRALKPGGEALSQFVGRYHSMLMIDGRANMARGIANMARGIPFLQPAFDRRMVHYRWRLGLAIPAAGLVEL